VSLESSVRIVHRCEREPVHYPANTLISLRLGDLRLAQEIRPINMPLVAVGYDRSRGISQQYIAWHLTEHTVTGLHEQAVACDRQPA
jgi:hypothetical protein